MFSFSFVSRYFLVSLLISSLTHWLSELGDLAVCSLGGDLAVCSLGGSLKSWGARCVLQTLHSLGRSWELGIHSWLCGTVPMVGFMARLCLSFSYPFLCGHFLSHPIWRSHSPSFWISLRGNCSLCHCIFSMSMEEVKFRKHIKKEEEIKIRSWMKKKRVESWANYNNSIILSH